MTKGKKNKKTGEAQSPADKTARSSSGASETSRPKSYAAAAAKPPSTEANEDTNTSATTPAVPVTDAAGGLAAPTDVLVSTPASPGIFKDDAVDVALPPTPDTRPANEPGSSDGKALGKSPGSDFSLLKKGELSEGGSPGQAVKNPGEKDPGEKDPGEKKTGGEGPSAGAPQLEVQDEAVGDPSSETATPKAGMGTDSKASLHLRTRAVASPFQKSKNSRVELGSKADWDKAFGSGDDAQQSGAAVEASEGTAIPASTVLDDPSAVEQAQTLLEMETALHACEVALQNCNDELVATAQERSKLQGERDKYKKELDEAHETLQAVHERRQRLQNDKDKHRIREADWEKEKEQLEAQIEKLSKGRPPEGTGENTTGNLPDAPSSSSGDAENAALKDEVQKLKDELRNLRAELEKARDELRTLQSYKDKREAQQVFRAQIANCTTENEKLEKYGGTMDRTSRLYQILKKIADFHDNGEPKPTADEYAQVKTFDKTLAERKRIMAQARVHPDPRGFMTPYLDKWDRMALEGGCRFISTARDDF